jgi:hypothetical protein
MALRTRAVASTTAKSAAHGDSSIIEDVYTCLQRGANAGWWGWGVGVCARAGVARDRHLHSLINGSLSVE